LLAAATKYLLENLNDKEVNVKKFEDAIGVGIVVSDDEIEKAVNEAIEKNKAEILEKR
jgi:nitrogen regulatory protein PII